MRSILQHAERSGVLVILPDQITQRLDVTVSKVTNNWDLITVLSSLRERGIQAIVVESEDLLTMVYTVTQPLGIKLFKLADGEFMSPDAIPQAVKMRLNLLDMIEIKQLEESASFFGRLEAGADLAESEDQRLANAVNTLIGTDEEEEASDYES